MQNHKKIMKIAQDLICADLRLFLNRAEWKNKGHKRTRATKGNQREQPHKLYTLWISDMQNIKIYEKYEYIRNYRPKVRLLF